MCKHAQRLSALTAVWLVALPGAQAPPGGASAIRVTIIQGQGAIHNIRQRTGSEAVVRVTSVGGQPVAGASVVFTLPSVGASGSFTGGDRTLVVSTDAQGQASMRGFRPNKTPGKVEIRVSASHRGASASATLTQFNMAVGAAPSGGGAKWAVLLLALGGAGAAGAILGTRGTSSSTPAGTPPPAAPAVISITAGAGAVGPPQ